MQNMVPLGTGNSRFMKSNIPASTTLQQLIQMLNNGTFPYDVGAVNPAGVSQQGTPLNKDTLLKDATAAMFGLGTDAVPNDVLSWIGKYNQYWWSRRVMCYKEKQVFHSSEYNLATGSGGNIQYSDSINISQVDGAITLVSPKTLSAWGALDLYVLRNKYCIPTDGNTPRNAVVYLNSNVIIDKYSSTIVIRNYSEVTSELGPSDNAEYVQSSDRSAYPDSGEQDGYEYQYLGVPFENAVSAPKIETGSYVGTGTYGSNNKNSLTFGIEPLVVMVCRSDSSSYASFLNPCKKSAGYENYGLSNLTWSDKSLSWNNQYDADYQLNSSNTTYYYIAFGF